MRKLLLSLVAMVFATSVNSQSINDKTPFTEGKTYINAGFSGLNLNYNSTSKWNLNAGVKVGYLLKDNFMLLGDVVLGLYQESPNEIGIGAGARYYIEQNGLYLGGGLRFRHSSEVNDFMPNVNVGYSFFLSRTVTIEPELYYDISTKSFKDYSGFGLRIGFGIYL